MNHLTFDVAVIGGGPGGSTVGSYLRHHNSEICVGIFERDVFPRDHVGESQLPIISTLLDELGVWDKVEKAGFPVKIGATYRWGTTDDLWDFNFLPHGKFTDEPRPAQFVGQRRETAFQVDRAVYDKILLDHAKDLGCQVFEGRTIREVKKDDDRILGLVLENGDSVEAKHYVDASGHTGFLRRNMGVPIDEPSGLKNIAIWDYWNNAEWAVSLGVGGTRVQVMSLGYGWLWFIPISESRTSIGLVCPADYYKQSGMRPEDLYLKAVRDESRIANLTLNATRENTLQTTKDWSFVAERLTGENWFLVGESAGFADPILAAGLTLTHVSAKEAALTILEMERGGDHEWLRNSYCERNRRKIYQHIRFADYWYSANGHFNDLKEYTREIAKDAGLDLDPSAAFRWLGTGGFIEDDMEVGGIAGFRLDSLHQLASKFSQSTSSSTIDGYSAFPLALEGSKLVKVPVYENGGVRAVKAYQRGNKHLPMVGLFGILAEALLKSPRLDVAVTHIARKIADKGVQYDANFHSNLIQTLEAMERDGWVRCCHEPGATPISAKFDFETAYVETNQDAERFGDRVPASIR